MEYITHGSYFKNFVKIKYVLYKGVGNKTYMKRSRGGDFATRLKKR
jgi:hypothetical protein